jgi:predicted alpha/beta-hydrolase family hydrolase
MAITIYLGHGASGTSASMAPFVKGLRARGIDAHAIDLPKRRAEEAVPALRAIVPTGEGIAVGGHSYGGRVASLALADTPDDWTALILFSYPLHRPGAPAWEERTSHWPRIMRPVLLLSGESDPFARIALLRRAVRRLPSAQLVTYPRLGHTLKPVLDDALDRAAAFLSEVSARP